MKHTEYIVPIGEEAKEFDEIFIGVLRKHKELIRCKDCKWFDMSDPSGTVEPIGYRCKKVTRLWREPDDYCKGAERKDEDGEIETWHSLKGNINAPKGTFDKIYEDDEL